MTLKLIIGIIVTLIFSSCSNKKVEEELEVAHYLHLSHTRTNTNPLLDATVEKLDFGNYEMLWLGGDLAQLTSADDSTMQHVDRLFDLSNPTTLWALGNHDYSNLERVKKFTGKPNYYSYHKNGITVVVLDTQDSLSNIVGEQKAFLYGILDSLKNSSHLVVLHHKLIWMYNYAELEQKAKSISNAEIGDCSYCINPNPFHSEIYPKLVELKKKGVEVLCIGGDIGFNAKQFEFETEEGIYFLASGIHANNSGNKALLFSHNLHKRQLTWEFVPLEKL